jgi:hypothetical protein
MPLTSRTRSRFERYGLSQLSQVLRAQTTEWRSTSGTGPPQTNYRTLLAECRMEMVVDLHRQQ